MTVWERINKRMNEKGILQKDLAKYLDTRPQTITDWKNGKTKSYQKFLPQIAEYLDVSVNYLLGKDEPRLEPNIGEILPSDNMYKRPLYESVSAGFGAYANNSIVGWIPILIENPYDVEDTFGIKVQGDSMYPKIEDGDIAIVRRQEMVDNGSIAVVMVGDDEGFIKKIEIGDDYIRLISLNPEYPPRTIRGEELNSVRIVGVVLGVNKVF